MYRFKAHATIYREVRFRSRLEARWAAWFDMVHWRWDYEPIDLEGWSPDFGVALPPVEEPALTPRNFYVEVKPYDSTLFFGNHAAFKTIYPRPPLFLGASPDVVLSAWDGRDRVGVTCLCRLTDMSEPGVRIAWIRAGNAVQWMKT